MGEDGSGIAVIGITSETIPGRKERRVVFIKSNIHNAPAQHFHKVPEHEILDAKYGARFQSASAEFEILFPYKEDFVHRERFNGHTIIIFKARYCNGVWFSLSPELDPYLQLADDVVSLAHSRVIMPERKKVHRFIRGMFRGKRYTIKVSKHEEKELPVTFDTPCRLFFPNGSTDHEVGKPIEERFGLESLGVSAGLSAHAFKGIDRNNPFHAKYPRKLREADTFTLRIFTDMIYDLVRIRHKHLPL